MLKRREEDLRKEYYIKCELKEGVPIHFVDDRQRLQYLMDQIPKFDVIGIDTEWKPHFVCTKEM